MKDKKPHSVEFENTLWHPLVVLPGITFGYEQNITHENDLKHKNTHIVTSKKKDLPNPSSLNSNAET